MTKTFCDYCDAQMEPFKEKQFIVGFPECIFKVQLVERDLCPNCMANEIKKDFNIPFNINNE